MKKHAEPSTVAQSIIIKLLLNKNVKSIEIWQRLDIQLGFATLSRSQLYK